jgi:hypothetical protein
VLFSASFHLAGFEHCYITGGIASHVLRANGTTLNTNAATSSYSYNHTSITVNQNYELQVTQGTTVITKNSAPL